MVCPADGDNDRERGRRSSLRAALEDALAGLNRPQAVWPRRL